MTSTKDILITGFALFSMFFGAGNLVLPPYLGKIAGEQWVLVTFGFFTTAVLIPILAIFAHAKLQGTMYDFGKKVSPLFSSIYCIIVYAISIALPAPRTASVTHEMAISPYFKSSALLTSTIYFFLVFIFVMNRSKVLLLLGRFLTPLIISILLLIIVMGCLYSPEFITSSELKAPFVKGVLEGYQTFDAIGAVVVGGILVISLNLDSKGSFAQKKQLIIKSGLVAGVGLLIIYAGLIYNGASFNSVVPENISRTQLLSSLSTQTLGNIGTMFLSVLISLACFTTAIGIVTGTADYIKGVFKNSQNAYTTTAALACVLGITIGQFDVAFIITIALPVLMFIYPITIVLIILNVIPTHYSSTQTHRAVVITTFIFSIPDFLQFVIAKAQLQPYTQHVPLSHVNLGWVLPALLIFTLSNFVQYIRLKEKSVS